MGKEKKILVHKVEEYPTDIDKLFNQFISIFNEELGKELVYDKLTELGPRENLSTKFKIGINDFKIDFEIQNSKLVISYLGNKKVLKIISQFIINCVDKAIKTIQ